MTDVKGIYRTGLLAQIEVLEEARDHWSEDEKAAIEVVLRTVNALRSSAPEFGFQELAEVAASVGEAPEEDLREGLERLLEALRLASQGSAKRSGPQHRILVISSSTELLAKVAKRQPDADVVPAPSAAEAKRLLELETVTGLLVDLVLPEQDGRRLIAELRRSNATATVPIAVLTPAKNAHIEAECASLEVSSLVVTPLDPEALTEAVASLVAPVVEAPQPHLAGPSHLQETFRKVRSRTALSEQPLTVAVLQVDGLTEVEQKHGSWAAFSIQDRIAKQVRAALRKNDLLARWTGGEMVALLVDTTLEGARQALRKAREAVQEEKIEGPDGRALDLTLSAGLAELLEVETLEHALAEADRYLLRARALGGNLTLDSSSDREATPLKVLVLEDDELVAFLAKQRLGRAGFEVTHVRSAGEAREHPEPDLWLVDTSLPDADLGQLLPELRQRSSAPILAVIPAGNRGLVTRAIELGANDYIVRPFDPLELQVRAQRLLRRPRISVATA